MEALRKYWDVISRYREYAVLQDEEGKIMVMEGNEDELPIGSTVADNEYLVPLEELDSDTEEEIVSLLKR